MTPYAETTRLRTRQLLADLFVCGWVVAWALAGRALFRTIDELRTATASARDAGAGLAGRLDDVARGVARLPVVGGELRRPFTEAADAARALELAGTSAGETVHSLALWAGWLLAALPVAWLLAAYAPGRIRWMREADAARRLVIDDDDLELFALRAATTLPLHRLRRVTPNPAAALAGRDYEPLAALELARLGLRVPRP